MIKVVYDGSTSKAIHGLYQWDYGQLINIASTDMDIPDGTEVQFYQGTLAHTAYLQAGICLIPDKMLQFPTDITMYVYIRSPTAGETVLSGNISVKRRPRPDSYVLPAYTDYQRLLPSGGTAGQVLVKKSDADYDYEWSSGGGAEQMTEKEVDTVCEMEETEA